MENNELFSQGFQHEIYIGLKDKDSYEELLTAKEFADMLSSVCAKENIAFSLLQQMGGYQHNKGYTTETSLRIVIIGADDDEIAQLAQRLKTMVNTDAVLVSKETVSFTYL